MWLSHGSESVPEQDNEIACQVIWFENSSHLWTGVWANNKSRVCQDSFFFKLLCSLHLPLQDMSDNVSSTEQKMAGAQVTGSGFSPSPESQTFLRCSEREKHSCSGEAGWPQCLLADGAAVAESTARVPPKVCR